MKEFAAFWKNYVNFSDRTTRRGYWMAYLFIIIAGIVVGIVSGISDAIGLLPIVYTVMYVPYNVLDVVWFIALILPTIAISVRRLRDMGKKWTWLFISLVPIVGIIWYIVLLCKPSLPDDGTPVV